MKTIIVPTDFSNTALNAAYYAAEVAMHVKADLTLLHVLPMPLIATDVSLPPDSYELMLQDVTRSLNEVKETLQNYTNDKLCITCAVTAHSFLHEMEDATRNKDIFAVVMGTSGAGATEAFFLGSFSRIAAEHLTRHPLIVVPPVYKFKGIQKIGLACDMRDVPETVPFQGIKDIFKHFDARLDILYVSKADEKMYPRVLTGSKFIQASLAALHPEIRIATSDRIKEGLEKLVHKSRIDLLIVVPKERNFMDSIFHKSLTKKMMSHPEVPVMIVH